MHWRPSCYFRESITSRHYNVSATRKGEGALTGLALEQFAKSCQKLCRQYNVPFIVNDHVELALEMNADGVHIGQDDTDLAQIRTLFPGKCIGVSVHSMEEMDAAVTGGADYVGIGPIFETTSKLDAKNAAGVTFLTQAREAYPSYPIVAIGGITTGMLPKFARQELME